MKNTTAINNACTQLSKSCEKIQSINNGFLMLEQSNPELVESYGSIRMDELEHIQILVLALTKLIADSEDESQNSDEGSIFGPGELTAEQGDKKKEDEE